MPEKKTTKNKAIKNTPKKERHFGVILENIDSNIHLVIERQDVLDRKLDSFQEGTSSNFETVFKYLSGIDEELKEIKTEIKDLKIKLDKKADLSRLDNLEKRVVKLELIIQRKNLANA